MEGIKQIIGFTIEVFAFVLSGYLVAHQSNFSYFVLIFAFIMAIYTGKQIKKDTIKIYKMENDC